MRSDLALTGALRHTWREPRAVVSLWSSILFKFNTFLSIQQLQHFLLTRGSSGPFLAVGGLTRLTAVLPHDSKMLLALFSPASLTWEGVSWAEHYVLYIWSYHMVIRITILLTPNIATSWRLFHTIASLFSDWPDVNHTLFHLRLTDRCFCSSTDS